jgi:hypothetical protein
LFIYLLSAFQVFAYRYQCQPAATQSGFSAEMVRQVKLFSPDIGFELLP